jgi:hypothetical protein
MWSKAGTHPRSPNPEGLLSFFRAFLGVFGSPFSRLKCFQHFYKIGHLTNPLSETSSHRGRSPQSSWSKGG